MKKRSKFSAGFPGNFRALLVIILTVISFSASAQYDSTKFRQDVNTYGFNWKNGKFKYSLVVPTQDTQRLAQADSGAMTYYHGVIYAFDGHYWNPFGVSSSGNDSAYLSGTVVNDSTLRLYRDNGDSSDFTILGRLSTNIDTTGQFVKNVTSVNDSTIRVFLGGTQTDLLIRGRAATIVSDSAWSLTGNSGTSPGTNKLGTNDSVDLVIATNGVSRLIIPAAGIASSTSSTDSVLVTKTDGYTVGKIAKTSLYPTWQQTLTAGSTLTGNNTISGGGYSFVFNNADIMTLNSTSASTIKSRIAVGSHATAQVYASAGLLEFSSFDDSGNMGNYSFPNMVPDAGTKAVRFNPSTGYISYADTTTGGGTPSLTQYRLAIGDASNLLSTNAAITGNRALISDANGVPTHSTVTNTELGYVSGVTSAIQTQLNAKQPQSVYSYSEKAASVQDYEWKRIANVPIGQWHDGIFTAVYKDTIIVMGGWNAGIITDSIWHSVDGGVTWSYRGVLPYAVHTPVFIQASDGYGYLIGADIMTTNTANRGKVYRTSDYRTWTLMTSSSPFSTRVLMAGVEFHGALYVGGGQDTTLNVTTGHFTDMYKSTDGGVNWTLLSNSLTFMGKNVSGTLCVFADKIWQVSGGIYDNTAVAPTYDKTVYSSDDGTNWKLNTSQITTRGVQYPQTIAWDGKLWLMQGHNVTNTDSITYMDRGGVWHNWIATTKPSANHASYFVVYKDSLIRTFGNTTNDVWSLGHSADIFNENAPINYKNRVRFDSLGTNVNGYNIDAINTTNGYNENRFRNTAGTSNFINWVSSELQIKPNSVTKLTLNASGNMNVLGDISTTSAKSLIAGSATSYTGTYYSTLLQEVANYPGLMLEGISNRFVLGLDGTKVGFRQENNGAITGIRAQLDITTGTFVLANSATNGTVATIAASAAMDIQSTIKGLLIPRMTTTNRDAISSPATGLQVYNTTTNDLNIYNSAVWRRVMKMQGADVASTAGAMTLGTDGTSFEITGTNSITLLSNVGWVNGDEVTLMFTSTATLVNGTATSGTNIQMLLAGGANFAATADDTITLILGEIGGTQVWREKCRSVN